MLESPVNGVTLKITGDFMTPIPKGSDQANLFYTRLGRYRLADSRERPFFANEFVLRTRLAWSFSWCKGMD